MFWITTFIMAVIFGVPVFCWGCMYERECLRKAGQLKDPYNL